MGNSVLDKFLERVDGAFVKGAQENAAELNTMLRMAEKQKSEQERARNTGLNISVEEIVVDPVQEPVLDVNETGKTGKKEKEEDFVL